MEVLSSRMLIRPADLERTRAFYAESLGLETYRDFGAGTVFFAGGGFVEVSGARDLPAVELWLQVRSVDDAREELAGRGVTILREPVTEPWGLREMWIEDPDGVRIAVIEVPEGHSLRNP
jgi:predicted enzyme related to lactoylglutathione lyase